MEGFDVGRYVKPGTLTGAGILFEGVFDAWQVQTVRFLKETGFSHRSIFRTRALSPLRGRERTNRLPRGNTRVLRAIKGRVTSSLLARVSQEDLLFPGDLLHSLQQRYACFNIKGLPVELRLLIYSFLVGQGVGLIGDLLDFYTERSHGWQIDRNSGDGLGCTTLFNAARADK